MDKTPHELLDVPEGTQLCFCGPHEHGEAAPLPDEPVAKHHPACAIWDWAMGTGRVTPEKRAGVYRNWLKGADWVDNQGDEE